ncbi:MAG: hypothetical protein UT63_C0019G0026 [Candidatus Gottesmanbacteria bacterium GW2011_GWC2_39_8]|uniref:Uncharacterized protein n=1 Tax=Candidatus Gottesmanbacteria bacterium GW2011_GWC2_39_8 TaxID=1618450 RepID=A0A0G0PYS9_9BACT|nr:MAG: hypothetical protein UT63_C0019G0026 [Candidatus Gottesmanbacteria bacterium GW2011_GWC2_39_8]
MFRAEKIIARGIGSSSNDVYKDKLVDLREGRVGKRGIPIRVRAEAYLHIVDLISSTPRVGFMAKTLGELLYLRKITSDKDKLREINGRIKILRRQVNPRIVNEIVAESKKYL